MKYKDFNINDINAVMVFKSIQFDAFKDDCMKVINYLKYNNNSTKSKISRHFRRLNADDLNTVMLFLVNNGQVKITQTQAIGRPITNYSLVTGSCAYDLVFHAFKEGESTCA